MTKSTLSISRPYSAKAVIAGGLVAVACAGALAFQPVVADAAAINEVEPNDSEEQAIEIQLGDAVVGTMDTSTSADGTEFDIYKVEIPSDGMYTYSWDLSNEEVVRDENGKATTIVMTVLYKDGETLYDNIAYGQTQILSAGTYYLWLSISDYKCDYTLTVNKVESAPNAVDMISAKAGKKKATLKWMLMDDGFSTESGLYGYNHDKGTVSYQIYYKIKGSKYKLAKTITKSTDWDPTYTKTGLKKGKKYSFKVRAYKTINGTNYYSAFSSAKTVKVK